MNKYLGIIVLLLCSFFAHGQELFFHRLTVENGLPHNSTNAFVEDKYGFIWIATLEGLCRFDGKNMTNYYSDNSPNTIITQRPIRLYKDKDGEVWVAFSASRSVCKYNYPTDDFTRYLLADTPLEVQENIWASNVLSQPVTSLDGVLSWRIEQHRLIQQNNNTGKEFTYVSETAQLGSLSDAHISSAYLDSNNILWLGTDNGGVNYADLNIKQFEHWAIADANSVSAISETENNELWVGTRNKGLLLLAKNTGATKNMVYSNSTTEESSRVRDVFLDSRNELWIGTRKGLYQYGSSHAETRQYSQQTSPSIPSSRVYAITEDEYGIVWFGTWAGLAYYSYKQDSLISFEAEELRTIRKMARAKYGGIWLATEYGLVFLDYDQEDGLVSNFSAIRHQHSRDNESLINNFVYSLDVDENGNVWVGTAKGVCCYNIQSNRFETVLALESLSDKSIFGLICLNDEVWMSYGNGLTCYNRSSMQARHYDKFDGLRNFNFSEGATFKSKAGELFFGGNNGVTHFFPSQIRPNDAIPKLRFTALKVDNKAVKIHQNIKGLELLEKPLYLTSELVFNHQHQEIEIEFSALHFSNYAKNTYAYRLIGLDNNWIYPSTHRNSVVYSSLPPGKYTLEVKARSSDGVWTNTPIAMEMTILPPWWFSWQAIASYFLTFILIVYFIISELLARKQLKYQAKIERIKAKRTEEIATIRSNFFTGISHELRTPVTLLIDPLRRLLQNETQNVDLRKTYELMNRNATRLLHLINQLLDFRRMESENMPLNMHTQDLVAFVRTAVEMFELTASKRNITLLCEVNTEKLIIAFDENILDKVLVNLLSNAFKYSEDNTQIIVRLIAHEKETVSIAVQDEGKGISPAMQEHIFDMFFRVNETEKTGSGIGLALCKKLIELHQGHIEVESQEGKGTSVTMVVPSNLESKLPSKTPRQMHDKANVVELCHEEMLDLDIKDDTALPILLIVEDNKDIREYVASIFNEDYQVRFASNGEAGVQLALEEIPDIIISDIEMPKLSGIELCKQLKADEKTSHIPIVLLTAYQSDQMMMNGYETGADDYVGKPFNSELLRIRVSNLLQSRAKLRALFGDATKMELRKISVNAADEAFINKAVALIEQNLADNKFTPDFFAQEMAVSRAQLFRKIKAMTGKTVVEFISTIRLNHAADLLLTSGKQISEISIICGFSDASNFRRSFVKKFGRSPSAYRRNTHQAE